MGRPSKLTPHQQREAIAAASRRGADRHCQDLAFAHHDRPADGGATGLGRH